MATAIESRRRRFSLADAQGAGAVACHVVIET
jgi:hypothetical protein